MNTCIIQNVVKPASHIEKASPIRSLCILARCLHFSKLIRPAKRFREFVNFSAYLDTGPNDDIVDILGFLSFEMVRTLCVKSLEVRERMEKSGTVGNHAAGQKGRPIQGRRGTAGQGSHGAAPIVSPTKRNPVSGGSGIADKTDSPVVTTILSPEKEPTSNPSEPTITSPSKSKPRQLSNSAAPPPAPAQSQQNYPVSLFAPPPSARQPLLPLHVLEAFAEIQREQGGSSVGGMRNFRGGLGRRKLALV